MLTIRLMILVWLLSFAAALSAQSPANGVWLADGYGLVFTLEDETAALYEYTSSSCLLVYEGPLAAAPFQPEPAPAGILLRDSFGTRLPALPVDALPDPCVSGRTAPTDDPVTNFEIFWQTFAELYPNFEGRGLDWDRLYPSYRAQAEAATTPEDLYAALAGLVAPLGDPGVSLTTPFATFTGGDWPEWAVDPETRWQVIADAVHTTGYCTIGGEIALDPQTHTLTGNDYLIASDAVFFGTVTNAVGYVNVLSFSEGAQTAEAVTAGFATALQRFAGKEAVVIDLRYNRGGRDALALALAAAFADSPRTVLTKHAPAADPRLPALDLTLTPQPDVFSGDVYLLTSRLTAGAAETFVLALAGQSNVTVIGEATAGAPAAPFERRLPNGWTFTLPLEVVTAADGTVYDSVGITPDVEVPFDPQAIAGCQDVAFQAAMTLIQGF